ncbi:hypothetical protein BDR05DRAFT_952273 [Suillus weaverae]|nr:hypothetical protein BDR05DRAFT_952273 [Suillus weaverae]
MPESRAPKFGVWGSYLGARYFVQYRVLSSEVWGSGFSWTPKSQVVNFGFQDSVVCSEYRALGPETRNLGLGTRVSGTRYSGQSIELQVTNPKPQTSELGAQDSGVQDSIFRTKYRAPRYKPQTPNFRAQSSGLGHLGLDIQDKVLSSEVQTPNPELQSSELGTQASGTQYSGQSIKLRGTNPKPRTSELGAWDSGIWDSIFRTKYQAPRYNPELRSLGPGRLGLDIQDKVSSSPGAQSPELRICVLRLPIHSPRLGLQFSLTKLSKITTFIFFIITKAVIWQY